MFFRLICWTVLGLLLTNAGCDKSDQPANPKVNMQGWKPHQVKIEDLKFPAGFPMDLGLAEAVKVYEQDLETDSVTWDSGMTPKEVIDYYTKGFKEIGYDAVVKRQTSMPGDNYVMEFTDPEKTKTYRIGVGQQDSGGQVSCFIFMSTEISQPENANSKTDGPKDSDAKDGSKSETSK